MLSGHKYSAKFWKNQGFLGERWKCLLDYWRDWEYTQEASSQDENQLHCKLNSSRVLKSWISKSTKICDLVLFISSELYLRRSDYHASYRSLGNCHCYPCPMAPWISLPYRRRNNSYLDCCGCCDYYHQYHLVHPAFLIITIKVIETLSDLSYQHITKRIFAISCCNAASAYPVPKSSLNPDLSYNVVNCHLM